MAANRDLGDAGGGTFEKPLNLQMSSLLLHAPIEALILSFGTRNIVVDSIISTMKLPI